jgi:hypothetical protein
MGKFIAPQNGGNNHKPGKSHSGRLSVGICDPKHTTEEPVRFVRTASHPTYPMRFLWCANGAPVDWLVPTRCGTSERMATRSFRAEHEKEAANCRPFPEQSPADFRRFLSNPRPGLF